MILFLNRYRKQFEPIDKQIIVLFTQKIVTKLSQIWFEDPDPEKSNPDIGVKNPIRKLFNNLWFEFFLERSLQEHQVRQPIPWSPADETSF